MSPDKIVILLLVLAFAVGGIILNKRSDKSKNEEINKAETSIKKK